MVVIITHVSHLKLPKDRKFIFYSFVEDRIDKESPASKIEK